MIRRLILRLGVVACVGLSATCVTLDVAGRLEAADPPEALPPADRGVARARVLDRDGHALATTRENPWNVHDLVPLHEVPELLREAILVAEDGRFFDHRGVDWRARLHALAQNVSALRPVRGASTISEQAAKMIHGRPRTLWSRWVAGYEARRLERRFGKAALLEFYVNQVPYADRRRGVLQAAHHLFGRDLETLSVKEMLALAVMIRSPNGLHPARHPERLERRIGWLAERMHARGRLDDRRFSQARQPGFDLAGTPETRAAPHFVRQVRRESPGDEELRTTLDGVLQDHAERLLERQIERLSDREVGDGAVLVLDHRTDEVLAWANAGGYSTETPGSRIDAVTTRRQPGSTLKPFVYALALEQGWTAATLIDDSPLTEQVGSGRHRFRNYSRRHYGPLRLRLALGNSLNVPAVRAADHVTVEALFERFRELGFEGLSEHPQYYGDGLALGNAEVSLFELVRAYAVLARGGVDRPPRVLLDAPPDPALRPRRLFASDVTSIITDILADPEARTPEFGRGGALELPWPTAVKTGTSNDYRDAWVVGFSDRHVVGVWMGNLDRREMHGVSGSIGPALVLRGVFAELRRRHEAGPLPLDRRLMRIAICAAGGDLPGPACPRSEEWFRPGHAPTRICPHHAPAPPPRQPTIAAADVRLVSPTPGLLLAMDPRIPDDLEAFDLELHAPVRPSRVEWWIDDRPVAVTENDRFAWTVRRGTHVARARVWVESRDTPYETAPVTFRVK